MSNAPSASIPLVVDLDGTLTPLDTLHESLLEAVVAHPSRCVSAIVSLPRGKDAFKSALARIAIPDVDTLPLRGEVADLIRQARTEGRAVVLATGAHRMIADAVAAKVGFFDAVFATEDCGPNLTGPNKAALLAMRYGVGGFDYVGDSSADIAVWKIAQTRWCVGSPRRHAHLRAEVPDLRHLADAGRNKPAWMVLRPHQWVKNLLVFLPMVAAHATFTPGILVGSITAFVAFCLAASLVYVANDLLDRNSDRKNPSKASRPIASGVLSIPHSLLVAALLAAGLLAMAFHLPWQATTALGIYLAANAAYTLHVKRRLLADVFLLAFMYVWRIETGALATGVIASSWLLGFSGFLFLSLAFAKRYAEVVRLKERDATSASGRAWKNEDELPLAIAGLGCGLSGSIILALYVTGDSFSLLYRNAQVALLLSPLFLYWIIRIWVQATRLELDEDPVLFAARDRISYLVAAVGATILFIASL